MRKSLLAVGLLVASLSHADWTDKLVVAPAKIAVEKTAAPTPAPTAIVTAVPVQTPDISGYLADIAKSQAMKPTVSGYIDAFAIMDTTNTKNVSNGMHLGTAQLTFKSDFDGMGGLIQLIYGDNAAAFTSPTGPSTPNIKQAYLHQDWGKFSVQAGKFIGFLGYELPDANVNLNYSRSPLFYMEPVYNMGVVAKYAINDVTNLIAYGANENSFDTSLDETKDVGASLQSLGTKGGFAFNWYRDNYMGTDFSSKDSLNAYAYYSMSIFVTLGAEYLNVVSMNSGAAYLNIANENAGIAFRVAVVNNPLLVSGQTTNQYTVTLKSNRGTSLNNYLEVVTNMSSDPIYVNTDGLAQNNQTSVILGTVYGF